MMDFTLIALMIASLFAWNSTSLRFAGANEDLDAPDDDDDAELEDSVEDDDDDADEGEEENDDSEDGADSDPELEDAADDTEDSVDTVEAGEADTEEVVSEYDAEFQSLLEEDDDEEESDDDPVASAPPVQNRPSSVASKYGMTDEELDRYLQAQAEASRKANTAGSDIPVDIDPDEPLTMRQLAEERKRFERESAIRFDQLQKKIALQQQQAKAESIVNGVLNNYALAKGKRMRPAVERAVWEELGKVRGWDEAAVKKISRRVVKDFYLESGRTTGSSPLKNAAKVAKKISKDRKAGSAKSSAKRGGGTAKPKREIDRQAAEIAKLLP